jgi:DNA-binding beta-propeller fold protein YncE
MGFSVRVGYQATDEVRASLELLGRTEDVVFSPDGSRLAIAGFYKNRVLILDVEAPSVDGGSFEISFTKSLTLTSPSLASPHGLAWADDETLLVANREGKVPFLPAPRHANSAELTVEPIHALGASVADFIYTPGSVALRRLDDDLVEALVCNGYANTVTRHLLDRRDRMSVIGSEIVLREGLSTPDGVAYSSSGKWVAVSNHDEHSVLIYLSEQLGGSEAPVGVLRGMAYPHGLRFTPDDRAIVVADAGAPYVHLFASPNADWSGTHTPVSAIQVVEDAVFAEANKNPQEGGPKGIAVSPDGNSICITCEQEPLVFYDISSELAKFGVEAVGRVPAGPAVNPRAQMISVMRTVRAELETLMEGRVEKSNLASVRSMGGNRPRTAEQEIEALLNSTSWKITAPLRAARDILRKLIRR